MITLASSTSPTFRRRNASTSVSLCKDFNQAMQFPDLATQQAYAELLLHEHKLAVEHCFNSLIVWSCGYILYVSGVEILEGGAL